MPLRADCEPRIKLTIINSDQINHGGFGQGCAKLLHGVCDTGSLNMSAKVLGMAYSKAWRLVKESEEQLGIQLLHRDGARGSTLTAQGAAFLQEFDNLAKGLQKHAEDEYAALVQRVNKVTS